jgi:hypothetical protein
VFLATVVNSQIMDKKALITSIASEFRGHKLTVRVVNDIVDSLVEKARHCTVETGLFCLHVFILIYFVLVYLRWSSDIHSSNLRQAHSACTVLVLSL